MPLASSGLSSSMSRQAFRALHNPPNISSTRSLHTPSFVPRVAPQQTSSPFSIRILHRTRAVLNAFVGHLTTPGTLRAPGAAARSMQSVPSRLPRIESNLSLPVRHALSVRMGAPRLPRPPAIPRSIAQVGLGTARNFTTGRPIFQNIADKIHNIPVASRAFLEADLDMRTKDDRALPLKLKRARSGKSKKCSRPAAAADVHFHPAATRPAAETKTKTQTKAEAKQFDKYFAPPQVPDVTTTLLVPLAPTPTARLPLAHTFAYDRPLLVPLLELSALHVDSERHAARVRALFEQLDAARAWDRGATCEALGGARGAGVLRVRFAGWSVHAVRGILGEAATGWCVLEEEPRAEEEEEERSREEEMMSDVGNSSAVAPDGLAELNLNSPVDPAYSFVLPTLDFSSASPAAPTPIELPSGVASSSSVSQSDLDVFSDLGYGSDGESSGGGPGPDFHAWIEPPSDALRSRTPSWAGLSFSSAFSQRLEEGPREEMF